MSDVQISPYEYLTPAVVGDFNGSGKQALLEALQTREILEERASDITSLVFTEILTLALAKDLSVDDIAEFMKLAISDELKAAIFCQVFDVFPHDDVATDLMARLYQDGSVIKASTLAQYVDSETLVKLDIVPSQALNRQMNTRKRDEFFTQKKFNLLHEEYEGYSRLISELCSFFQNEDSDFLADHALEVVYLLIGHYLLDPNRVLDIIINISGDYIVGNHCFITSFFKKSPWWPQTEGNCNDGLGSLNVGGNPAVVSLLALRLLKQTYDRLVPETFRILIALFIKDGLISFGQIYPYFSPSDDDMNALETVYKQELEKKVLRASANALALAAPLADDDNEDNSLDRRTGSANTLDVEKTVKSLSQNNMRIQMLKCFLGQGLYWPSIYILSQYTFLVHVDQEISQLMHRVLAAVIDPLHLELSPLTQAQVKCFQEQKLITIVRSYNTVRFDEPPGSHVYCFNPIARVPGRRTLTYFVTDWASGLPVLRSANDLLTVLQEFLKFFGPVLADNQANFIKICEIIASDLKRDSSEEQKETWFRYFRSHILPSIGFIPENAIPVNKAYEILSFFLADDRFNLYGELYQVMAKTNPHVEIAYGKAERATKDVLKRLSKENVAPMMRRLAKISLSNPLPCFLTILQQLESYDNLNTLIVETAAYFNDYGWDNMTLAFMMRLTSTGRSNKQANGLNERQWIQSLSSFIGKICQKYPNSVDLDTLLRYLLLSLHSSGSTDLVVLKEIMSSMGGIQSITNLTQLQIDMINSEPSLRRIVYKTIDDKRYEYYHSGTRVREALTKDRIVNEFLVLLCKINRELIDTPGTSHLKVLASMKDEVDSVLHILCTLVGFFGKDTTNLISIDELIRNYNVPIVWAFEFWRDFLVDSSLDDVQAQIESALPSGHFEQMSPKMFVAFWKLRLYDLNYSPQLYNLELAKLNSRVSSLREEYSFARRDKSSTLALLESLRSSISEIEAFASEIPSQKKPHEHHARLVDEHLIAQLNKDLKSFDEFEAREFLQLCVLPRAVHSSFDAIYSAEFIFKLHKIKITGYSLITALDALFRNNIFFPSLFTCTPTEAENLGIFMSAVLKELNAWLKEETFVENTLDNGLCRQNDDNAMTFAGFRKSVYEYHTILLEDVSRALEVTTYMSRMNAITYLKNLLGVYPIVEDHCESVVELIDRITTREKRDDLKLSSSALIGHVKSRKSSWVHLWDFIDMEEDVKKAHMQKRKKIEDLVIQQRKQEEQRKLEFQREENRKRQIEEQEKLDKLDAEKAESRKEATMNSISYDESDMPSSRTPSRNNEAAKGRYDSYSQNLSIPANPRAPGSGPDKPATPKPAPPSQTDAFKEPKGLPPSGPSPSNLRQSPPEAQAKPKDTMSREPYSRGPLSDDLLHHRIDQKEKDHKESSAKEPLQVHSQQKPQLSIARTEHRPKNDSANREASKTINDSRCENSTYSLRSATPVGPRKTPAASTYSAREPREPPSARSLVNRTPRPPQVALRERFSSSYTPSKERVPLPPQEAIRGSSQLPSQSAGSSRVLLPPQQPPKGPPQGSRLAPKGHKNAAATDKRDKNSRYNACDRRPSGEPLPPPALPPPPPKEHRNEGEPHDKKRRYRDRGWYSDKRLRN